MEEDVVKKLTGRQARFLRGLGHHLRPLAIIGREGITDNFIRSLDELLCAHELVKVKLGQGCGLDRREAAAIITDRTGSLLAQEIGKTVLLYRENPDRGEKGLTLP